MSKLKDSEVKVNKDNRKYPNKINKKKEFPEHYSGKQLSDGLKRSLIFQSEIRINARNYKKAYVLNQDGNSDILIEGLMDRNRALSGDIVAYKVLPFEHWRVREKDMDAINQQSLYDLLVGSLSLDKSTEDHASNSKVDKTHVNSEQECPSKSEVNVGDEDIARDVNDGKQKVARPRNFCKDKAGERIDEQQSKGTDKDDERKLTPRQIKRNRWKEKLANRKQQDQRNTTVHDAEECTSKANENNQNSNNSNNNNNAQLEFEGDQTDEDGLTDDLERKLNISTKTQNIVKQNTLISSENNESIVPVEVEMACEEETNNIAKLVEQNTCISADRANCSSSNCRVQDKAVQTEKKEVSTKDKSCSTLYAFDGSDEEFCAPEKEQQVHSESDLETKKTTTKNSHRNRYKHFTITTNVVSFEGTLDVESKSAEDAINILLQESSHQNGRKRKQSNNRYKNINKMYKVNNKPYNKPKNNKEILKDTPVNSVNSNKPYNKPKNDKEMLTNNQGNVKNQNESPKKESNFIMYQNDPELREFLIKRFHKQTKSLNYCVDDNKDILDKQKKQLNLLTHGIFNENIKNELYSLRETKIFITAQVVSVIEKVHLRACSGHLREIQGDKVKFIPTDNRMPVILLNNDSTTDDFRKRPQDYLNLIFITKIDSWNSPRFALGSLVRSLGEAGEIDPETSSILYDNDVDDTEFSDQVLESLPKASTVEELDPNIADRLDLRNQCIFTVDPMSARDLDDALSCQLNDDGTYRIGVHIADVSHFITPGGLVDNVASSRCTSVYMTQKVIPMLPRLLCEELCSLNPDVDRLTFSVIWNIDAEGNIYSESFQKSVIRSCAKLCYEHAQGFIDQPNRKWTAEELPAISKPFTAQQISDRVLILDKIAKALKRNRFKKGSLRIDNLKIQFKLDESTGMPNGFKSEQRTDSNKLIEEFMLLANMAVAQRIFELFRDKSVLRRHPEPKAKIIAELEKLFEDDNFKGGSSFEIQKSMDDFEKKHKNNPNVDYIMNVLSAHCAKSMQLALYFCPNKDDPFPHMKHYALSCPLYTHFTSPIRRYADVMVHRILAATLDYSEEKKYIEGISQLDVKKICNRCNLKKKNAKICSELSLELYLGIFIKNCGPLKEEAIVLSVMDQSFDVILLRFGCTKRVYIKDLELTKWTYNKESISSTLLLHWAHNNSYIKQTIKMFETVTCQVSASTNHNVSKFEVKLLKPV